MQADLLVVQMCEFLDDGDGVYRFHSPSRGLSRLPGVVAVDCDLHHRFLPRLAEAADVLILGGFDSDLVPLLERRRAEEAKVSLPAVSPRRLVPAKQRRGLRGVGLEIHPSLVENLGGVAVLAAEHAGLVHAHVTADDASARLALGRVLRLRNLDAERLGYGCRQVPASP